MRHECESRRRRHARGVDLEAEITELCAYRYALEARFLDLLREFDAGRYWECAGFHSCAHWLNLKCSIGLNAAREKLRVAHALAELPKVAAAFAAGRLSYSKVRAMTRIADNSNEDYLMMIATHGTAYHVETLVRKSGACSVCGRQPATRSRTRCARSTGITTRTTAW